MTVKELARLKELKMHMQAIKTNAKAIYLLTDISETFMYLDAHVDAGNITEVDAFGMVEEISNECANVTMAEINRFRKQLERR